MTHLNEKFRGILPEKLTEGLQKIAQTARQYRTQVLSLVAFAGFAHEMQSQIDPSRDQNTRYAQRIHAVMDTETANLGAADNEENFNKGATVIQNALNADVRMNYVTMVVDREYPGNIEGSGDGTTDANNLYTWFQDTANNADNRDYHIFFNKASTPSYEGWTSAVSTNNGWTYSVIEGGYDSGTTQGHEFCWATDAAAGYTDGLEDIQYHSDGSSIGFPADWIQNNGKTLERPNLGGKYIPFYDTDATYSNISEDGFIHFTSLSTVGLPSWVDPAELDNQALEGDGDGQSTTTGFVNYFTTYNTLRAETTYYNPDTGQYETFAAPVAPQVTVNSGILTLDNAGEYDLNLPNTTDPNFAGIYYTPETYEFYLYADDNVANDQQVAGPFTKELLTAGLDLNTLGLDETKTYKLVAYAHYTNGVNFNNVSADISLETPDTTPPVPDVTDLPDITAQCEVTALTPPTATDDVDGTITGTTTTTLPITESTTITWTYTDSSGNSFSQTQEVVIDDTISPVVDNPTLSDLTAQCEVNSLTPPTATDNCDGSITGTTTTTLPITESTTITWNFVDNDGNQSSQTQEVVIDDTIAPEIPANVSVTNETSASISLSWNISTDNCEMASYKIYRDGNLVGTIAHPTTTFTDSGLSSETNYDYTITAVDVDGNESTASVPVTGTTEAATDTEAPTAPNIVVDNVLDLSFEVTSDGSTDNTGVATTEFYLDTNIDESPNGTLVYTSVESQPTSYEFTGLTAGTNYETYTRTTDAAGNVSPFSNVEQVTTTLDVEDYEIPGLKIYPNPVRSTLNINLETSGLSGYEIYNATGQKVDSQAYFQPTLDNQIDVSRLSQGIYIMKVTDNNGRTAHIRFIKN